MLPDLIARVLQSTEKKLMEFIGIRPCGVLSYTFYHTGNAQSRNTLAHYFAAIMHQFPPQIEFFLVDATIIILYELYDHHYRSSDNFGNYVCVVNGNICVKSWC